uniref:Uncharacterized protein n=1 Tax=Schizaphis graminum TaxID=13262 RepID=A0A2S2NT02_SCHGA
MYYVWTTRYTRLTPSIYIICNKSVYLNIVHYIGAVLCGRPVWLTDGDTLYLRWQSGLGLLNRCSVVLPNGTETTLSDTATAVTTANLTYVGDGYQSGQCGLRAVSVMPGVGNWTLTASSVDGRYSRDTSRVTCIGKRAQYLFILPNS